MSNLNVTRNLILLCVFCQAMDFRRRSLQHTVGNTLIVVLYMAIAVTSSVHLDAFETRLARQSTRRLSAPD